jgi:hypothetical protein
MLGIVADVTQTQSSLLTRFRTLLKLVICERRPDDGAMCRANDVALGMRTIRPGSGCGPEPG